MIIEILDRDLSKKRDLHLVMSIRFMVWRKEESKIQSMTKRILAVAFVCEWDCGLIYLWLKSRGWESLIWLWVWNNFLIIWVKINQSHELNYGNPSQGERFTNPPPLNYILTYYGSHQLICYYFFKTSIQATKSPRIHLNCLKVSSPWPFVFSQAKREVLIHCYN